MLLDRIIDLLNLIIDKNLDFVTTVSIFGLSLPFMLSLTVPMAVLLASIMAFGRLSVDNEIIACKACGINIYKLMRSTVLAALLLSFFMMYFNNAILPDTNHLLKNLMIKVNYRRPVTAIVPGSFNVMKNYTIYAKERIEEELYDIVIYNREKSNFPTTIFARKGIVQLLDGGNSLQAILYDGEMHERDANEPEKYQMSRFARFTLNLPDLGYKMNEAGTDYRGDRELSASAMMSIIKQKKTELHSVQQDITKIEETVMDLEKQSSSFAERDLKRNRNKLNITRDKKQAIEADIRKYSVEIHKKYAIALSCLIFVLVGAPVGMMTRTSGVGMAFTVSAVVFLIYYGSLTLGEELADRGTISPFIAMWFSNIIFAATGIYLIVTSVKETRSINLSGLKTFLKKIFNK
jgi:lipopolysaccharide export system permease protein